MQMPAFLWMIPSVDRSWPEKKPGSFSDGRHQCKTDLLVGILPFKSVYMRIFIKLEDQR